MCQNVFEVGGLSRASLGELTAPPNTLAGFGEGNRQGTMEGAREQKGTEGERKEERKGEKGRGMEFRGLRHWF